MNKNYCLKILMALLFTSPAFAEEFDPFFELSCSRSQVKVIGNTTSLILTDCFVGKHSGISPDGQDQLSIYGVNISYNRTIQSSPDPTALLKLFHDIQQQQARVNLTAGFHQFNSSGGMSDHWVVDRIGSMDRFFWKGCDGIECSKLPYLPVSSNDPNVD